MDLSRSWLLLSTIGVVVCACRGEDQDAAQVGIDRAALRGAAHESNDAAVVAIVTDDTPFCTATLIAPRVALTAAHCVSDLDRDTRLEIAADVDDSRRVGARVLAIAPSYRSDATGADLALLALDAPLDDVTPIEVFAGSLDPATLRNVRHVGFSEARRATATQDVVALTADEIAVAEAEGGTRPCFGDSGGPALATVGSPPRERVVGVISRAAPGDRDCTGATTWDSRTDVLASWIATHVAEEEAVHETHGCTAAPPARARAAIPGLVAAALLATFRRRRVRCTLDGS